MLSLEMSTFPIGELARRSEVSRDTLRYYEQEKLIEPAGKSPGGYRLYDKSSAIRIRFIKQAQSCGFTLAEIRELLILRSQEAASCRDVRQRAIEKKLQLENKIRSMRIMSEALDSLIADCTNETHSLGDCTILAALESVNLSPQAS